MAYTNKTIAQNNYFPLQYENKKKPFLENKESFDNKHSKRQNKQIELLNIKEESKVNNKEESKNNDSFNIEENEDELAVNNNILKHKKLSRKDFEKEMYKCGLLDKIDNIQQLKKYFDSEIGGNICTDSVQGYVEDNKDSSKSITFPFHKRARSNSPPKNGRGRFLQIRGHSRYRPEKSERRTTFRLC